MRPTAPILAAGGGRILDTRISPIRLKRSAPPTGVASPHLIGGEDAALEWRRTAKLLLRLPHLIGRYEVVLHGSRCRAAAPSIPRERARGVDRRRHRRVVGAVGSP